MNLFILNVAGVVQTNLQVGVLQITFLSSTEFSTKMAYLA
jgi:hypothetical protein